MELESVLGKYLKDVEEDEEKREKLRYVAETLQGIAEEEGAWNQEQVSEVLEAGLQVEVDEDTMKKLRNLFSLQGKQKQTPERRKGNKESRRKERQRRRIEGDAKDTAVMANDDASKTQVDMKPANDTGTVAKEETNAPSRNVEDEPPLKEGQSIPNRKQDVEWSTSRFRKHHATWVGKGSWKVHDHARTLNIEELEDDDYSSAWLECLEKGIPWGGRGAGGRGVQRVTGETADIYIPNVTMSRGTKELLQNSVLRLMEGRRYALIGENGVGKTTLLKRIANGSLPGFPPWIRVQLVEQELAMSPDYTAVDYVVRFDFERTRLLLEEQELISREDDLDAQRLTQIYERLEQIDAYTAEQRAEDVLKRLGFNRARLDCTVDQLSGGWRMRVALAGAIFMEPNLLLLDEPTNHISLSATEWLKQFLMNYEGTILMVSHDRDFINHVCTDLIVMRKKRLEYFPGTYAEYRDMVQQKRQGQSRKAQAHDRQREHLQSYVDKQRKMAKDRKSKGGDPKKQAQVRSRQKKLERLGATREDGKYFKVSYDNLGYDPGGFVPIVADADEKPPLFKFPACTPLSGTNELVTVEEVSFSYGANHPILFENFSIKIEANMRIGVIGENGSGKSTLVKVLIGELQPRTGVVKRHPALRIGFVAQHLIEDLDKTKTPVQIICEKVSSNADQLVACGAMANALSFTELDARNHLGSFGLHGKIVLQTIGTLSGGQKTRVVFALESLLKPHLLVLDEPTNHLSMGTIEVLEEAVQNFNGAVISISHDITFLANTCKQLWALSPNSKTIAVYPQIESIETIRNTYLSLSSPTTF